MGRQLRQVGLAVLAAAMVPMASYADEGYTRYEEPVPRTHSTLESLQYLGNLYAATLGVYLYISRNEVFNNVTLQSYVKNFGNISIFDQDLPSSNWGVHLLTGSVAFEFYRARSYTLDDAFFMTLAQECLFQFTVETMLFPTGMENIVNTGVVGTIIGRGLEVASLPLLNSHFFLFKGLGYLINLPALFGFWESKTTIVPMVANGKAGVTMQVRF